MRGMPPGLWRLGGGQSPRRFPTLLERGERRGARGWGAPKCACTSPKSPPISPGRGSTGRPGNGCQGCPASLAPDALIRELRRAPRRDGAAPGDAGGEKQPQKPPPGDTEARGRDAAVLCLGDPSPPRPLAHLSTCSRSSPGLCLILFCASTLSISAALSPLMETMTSPGRRSPAAAFPCSITSEEKGDTGTKPPGSEPPSSGAAALRPSCASVAKVTTLQGRPRPQIHPKSTQIWPQIPFTHSLPSPLVLPKQHQPHFGVQRTRTDGPPPAPTQPVWGRRPFPQSANPRGGQTGSCSSRAAPLSTRPAPQPGGELLPWRR